MNKKISRRTALKLVTAATVVTGSACTGKSKVAKALEHKPQQDNWRNTHDRVFLGGDYWANPMEDWRVADGGAECQTVGGQRSVHSLTHQVVNAGGDFSMSVNVNRIADSEEDGGAGFRLGVRSEINEYRSNCFVQSGYDMGIKGGDLVLAAQTASLPDISGQAIELRLSARAQSGQTQLTLEAYLAGSNNMLASVTDGVSSETLLGNVALVSNFSNDELHISGARYRFSDWRLQGSAFAVSPKQAFGPILWTMYTLSDTRSDEGYVLKLSALTGPMGEADNQELGLEVQRGKKWQSLAKADLDGDAWVATFRIPNWDESKPAPFRVVYRETHKDGTETLHVRNGTVQANPVDRPMRMAALTCQNDYGFPYEPVAINVEKMNPDVVFFSGDQIYESHGGFGLIRTPVDLSLLNYLRKFYQFGWAFGEVMRNQPTVCLPDDHDVLQGNLWGEAGMPMQNIEKDPGASVLGGYIEKVRVVNAVHRSTLAHHPDAYDPAPLAVGMSVYFGEMVYGNVGFAILADRQWKSGPERINVEVGVTGKDESPEYYNPAFNPPGLELLGERQEKFLEAWGQDWRGHSLKAVLSQTVFAGIATHQPLPERYLKYDFDSSGWPSLARNRAVELMRPSMALHICGDTHLGTLSQYGVDKQRDSNWAFCTPAISAGWPRWWRPDAVGLPHTNRPDHGLAQTGEYLDSFSNKIYVYAAGNPEVGKSANRYEKAHQKGSGFGVISFDTEKLTYTMEAYRFLIDVTDSRASNQFPGWPVTIHQEENKGVNRLS